MPWETVVGSRENTPDEAGRAGVDVAIGADEPSGDRAHPRMMRALRDSRLSGSG